MYVISHTSLSHTPTPTQTYIVPQISLFGDVSGNPEALFNNIRVYGTILLLLMALIVFVGVKIVRLTGDSVLVGSFNL